MKRRTTVTAMNPAALKELYDRRARAVERRPALGRTSGHACVHLGTGFACAVHLDDHLLEADRPESEGGTGGGPTPGQLMRASLGACLAMGYRLWGARLGTAVESVDVEISCEYDQRGRLDLSPAVAIGWQRIAVHVVIVSPDAEADVRRVVEIADRLSPMLANLAPAVERTHRLTIVRPRTARTGV